MDDNLFFLFFYDYIAPPELILGTRPPEKQNLDNCSETPGDISDVDASVEAVSDEQNSLSLVLIDQNKQNLQNTGNLATFFLLQLY